MLIGIPKEIKDHEYRVGLTPAGAHALGAQGHRVIVQSEAGARVGFPDSEYVAAGATIVQSAAECWAAELIVKVKELQPTEYAFPKAGQVLFAYLHLAPEPQLLDALLSSGVTGIAYETVTDTRGRLPLLAPMSRIAGKLSVQFGAWALQMANGGSGVLLGGVPGVLPANVLVIGGGSVGSSATRVAAGMGAHVTVLDNDADVLAHLDEVYEGRLRTAPSDPMTIAQLVVDADVVVGATLTPGKLAPKLITRAMLQTMRTGSVLVDVSIDQGGIAETSRPTSHSEPTYVEEGVLHYCVPNMPSAVARTATLALTNATLPYVLELAGAGPRAALARDASLRNGLQTYAGRVTHAGLAQDVNRPWLTFDELAASQSQV